MPGARPVHLGGSGYCLERQRLIDVLTDRARASGAEVCFGSEVVDPADVGDHDLVVLADGAGSRLRRTLAGRFGTTASQGRNRHVWLGTSLAFEPTPLPVGVGTALVGVPAFVLILVRKRRTA